MGNFNEVKGDLALALDKFNATCSDYKERGCSFRDKMLNEYKNAQNQLQRYAMIIVSVDDDNLSKEKREALKYLSQAQLEYSEYLRTEPLSEFEEIPETPFSELEAAHYKSILAEEWVDIIRKAYHR